MNYLAKKILHIFLFPTIILLSSYVHASDKISVESTVIFNTACARCHEGECSGRMSFHLPEDAANQHIRRHGGTLSQEQILQLIKLLRYMKEECSFYPLPFALINDKIWEHDVLNKFQSPSRQAYFIYLGLLEPGMYQLLFEEHTSTKFCVEIINDEFEFTDKDSLYEEDGKKKLKFHIEQRSDHFLRLTAQKPFMLKKLELETIE